MFDHSIAFDRPYYLVLLLIIPVLWRLSYRSLAPLGPWRRAFALGARTFVTVAIVVALADVQYQRRSDGLTVVYLLDQSLSVPADGRDAMLDYVAAALDVHARPELDDRFGVIAFAREAAVETPPVAADVPPPVRIESQLNPEHSDLASAVRQAQALFPADAARRIVLLTDGNENAGRLYREARAAADAGISIDVVPVYLNRRSEIAVEKIDLPPHVRRGQPFDIRVVLNRETAERGGSDLGAASITGTLQVTRRVADREETVASEKVTLPPGKQVFTIRQELDNPDFYRYAARFTPDDATADGAPQNNVAAGFTHLHGNGRVLFIENYETQGEFAHLVDRLRGNDIDVTVTATDRLFDSLVDLQRYDAVVLANVSRSSIDDADSGASFTDEQIDMLVQNTREMGSGLIMLGGPDTFGAGGWANTKLEEAMPVDFQVKAAEVVPSGALSIVIDRSGSMTGEKLEMSKAAAIAAIKTMGRRDYISVVAFDSAPASVVPLQRVGNYSTAARRIDVLGPGGGTDAFPAMVAGFAELRKADAAVTHMILLTDGQTPVAKFRELVSDMRRAGMTVTTVAVGADANIPLLQQISAQGGGKFYLVRNPRGLPRIFLREARRVSRPLVYEPAAPVSPFIVADHEILRGIAAGVPPVKGLVLTTLKQNPLVEVLLRSPQPAMEQNATVLAAWTYGAGKAAAFTTDGGRRWTSAWQQWDGYDKFFTQLVRWAMRPTGDAGDFAIATQTRDGRTEVVVTSASGSDAAAIAEQPITALALAPDLTELPVAMRQTAPGRYVGEFPSAQTGSYLVVVNAGGGRAPLRTGVSIGYSAEYRDRETNLALLESVAGQQARGGQPGKLYRQGLDPRAIREPGAENPFRRDLPKPTSTQPVWPWLIVCGSCVFWCDVFIRRVPVNFAWLGAAVSVRDRLRRRDAPPTGERAMERLKSRKRAVAECYANRVQLPATEVERDAVVDDVDGRTLPSPPNDGGNDPADVSDAGLTPTERLLRAKQSVQRGRPHRLPDDAQ